MSTSHKDWWRNAIVYQVYLRSFADSGDDGDGDIAGLIDRLPYLRDLGVDALWLNPWYSSPFADGGYDVANYRDISPRFGTLDEAKALIDLAHDNELKIVLDIVPNHSSVDHAWFQAALAAEPGSPERARYVFCDGTGPSGEKPPSNWRSIFGGSAWERITESDGAPGQWYLHLFDVSQPDFNWENPDVHSEFLDVLRYWFDVGVDGFRVDSAQVLAKDLRLPDIPYDDLLPSEAVSLDDHPFLDRDGVHEVYRTWRTLADSYDPPRVFVAEVGDHNMQASYARPGELHGVFNFEYLRSAWEATALRSVIDSSMTALATVTTPVTWVLENHDAERVATRYGRAETHALLGHHRLTGSVNRALGLGRARAAGLLILALPGSTYIYQGQELGLPEVLDLPEDALQDPVWGRSNHSERGRDGCRVPLPWTIDGLTYGFGRGGSWLPQPDGWGKLSVEAQQQESGSMLSLYRSALRIRQQVRALREEPLTWADDCPRDVLTFTRGARFTCVTNLSAKSIPLPKDHTLILSSDLGIETILPPDTTAWLMAL